MEQLFERMYFGNTVLIWSLAVVTMLLTMSGLRILRATVVRRLKVFAKGTKTEVDDLVVDLLGRTKLFFLLFLSFYAGSLVLRLPDTLTRLLQSMTVLALLFQGAIWANALIAFSLSRYVARRMEHDAAEATTISALGFISKLVLWSLVVLLALDNLGVDVTAMVAGLGVGGIAVSESSGQSSPGLEG